MDANEDPEDMNLMEDLDEGAESDSSELGDDEEEEPVESPMTEPGEDAEHFDIALAAEHTYMGEGVSAVGGCASVVSPGQSLVAPALAAPCIVFPGETVPLRLAARVGDALLQTRDKLVILLVPEECGGAALSVWGTLCEVVAAGRARDGEGDEMCLKARALHRVRLKHKIPTEQYMCYYDKPRPLEVTVLAESAGGAPLSAAAPPSLLPLAPLDNPPAHAATPATTHSSYSRQRNIRRLAAATTPWPLFLYDAHAYSRLRAALLKYFKQCNIEFLPQGAVALSHWVAGNASLSYSARLSLLRLGDSRARLTTAHALLLDEKSALYCARCGAEAARRGEEVAMTSAGLHAHYTNPGGYTHSVVTVRAAPRLALSGAPSTQYSWFPGYAWTVAVCPACREHLGWRYTHSVVTVRAAPRLAVFGAPSTQYSWFPGYAWTVAVCPACREHLGWRFDACNPKLFPRRFFGLCRNVVTDTPPARPPRPALAEHHAMFD